MVTLYKISLFDLLMTLVTGGFWVFWIYYSNGVEVPANALEPRP